MTGPDRPVANPTSPHERVPYQRKDPCSTPSSSVRTIPTPPARPSSPQPRHRPRMSGGRLVIVTAFDPKSVRVQDLPPDLRHSTTVHPASPRRRVRPDRTGARRRRLRRGSHRDTGRWGGEGGRAGRRRPDRRRQPRNERHSSGAGKRPEPDRPFGTLLGTHRRHRRCRRPSASIPAEVLSAAMVELRCPPCSPRTRRRIRDVRLRSLRQSPEAFTSTYAQEAAFDESTWRGPGHQLPVVRGRRGRRCPWGGRRCGRLVRRPRTPRAGRHVG